jgi:hypothetical protein
MQNYLTEIEKQREFYKHIRINPDLRNNTDGVYKGNLFENKLNIDNIDQVLFQAIKYASRIRERGEKLPANIILNDLTEETAYIFQSKDLLTDIEEVYFGAASKNNDGFYTKAKPQKINYSNNTGLRCLLEVIGDEKYTPYHVDYNNILGLSWAYYKVKQDKDGFLKGADAEIRRPTILKDRIIPYAEPDNFEFEAIMDCLNPTFLQRELGAYYTPPAYANKMHEMLIRAIEEVPKGMDYAIIDRCAGVGNLEKGLPDHVLSHCILSTIEPNEYQILRWKYADKSAVVIPNRDALAYDVIPAKTDGAGHTTNDYVRKRVSDPNCVIILVENPPFSEAGAGGVQTSGKKENKWKESFVYGEMKKDLKKATLNDLANLFIWSGFKYYLTKSTDSYILYAPIKCWSFQHVVNKQFKDGFLGNRRHFHAKLNAAISCIWWQNEDDGSLRELSLVPYDIDKKGRYVPADKPVTIKRAQTLLSSAYEKRVFADDQDGILCEKNGKEVCGDRKERCKPIFNDNIVAYLVSHGFSIDRKHAYLVRCGIWDGHGFFVRSDNFVEKLPLFVAAVFPYDKWWKADVYAKTYDGEKQHLSDKDFLKKCLLYTGLSQKNKCRSFQGSDGRFYRNELCFHGEDTLASRAMKDFEISGLYGLDSTEKALMGYWKDVLREAANTDEYKETIKQYGHTKYGLWQIMEEINLKVPSGQKNRYGKDIMKRKYPSLNTEIDKLKNALKKYYELDIIPRLFYYELIK